jgi:hypothetical protein
LDSNRLIAWFVIESGNAHFIVVNPLSSLQGAKPEAIQSSDRFWIATAYGLAMTALAGFIIRSAP